MQDPIMQFFKTFYDLLRFRVKYLPEHPILAHPPLYASFQCDRPKVTPIYRVSQEELPDFGRVFLMVNYTDITQNTYVQSRTVTEVIAREKCGLHRSRRTVRRP